ncbi:MAG: alpha-N-arabinofuranosidase [Eubacteriales bacterium]
MKNLYIIVPDTIGMIAPEIYGHFSEHIGGVFYDGIWVGEDSPIPNIRGLRLELIERFRKIRPAVLRWPGGCFAETYDWRDGIGERSKRPVRINWWYRSDGRYEPNQVGTHEFIDFCRLVGAEPYFAANITSTTPLDIRDWIDYCNSPRGTTSYALLREKNGSPEPFNVKYWGVGNENWGGGGNMTPETYAHEFRKYAAVMDNTAPVLCLIGCGPNGADYNWTQRFLDVFASSGRMMGAYSMHYYCGSSGDPVAFSESEWYQLLCQANQMETILNRHWNIIKGFGMEQQASLFVDEWGCWHPGGSGPSKGYNLFEQQSTMRDAMVTALTLNIFNNNCDKVKMSNTAQLVNNLHTLFLTSGDKFAVTPTYHIYDMYKEHQGGKAVRVLTDSEHISFTAPDGHKKSLNRLSASASVKEDVLTLTIANLSATDSETLKLVSVGISIGDTAEATLLTHKDIHAHNTFDAPSEVTPVYGECRSDTISLPPASVMTLRCMVKK